MQRSRTPPLPNGSHPPHSYTSSSDESYEQYNGRSRSASGTSQTPYDDFQVSPPPKFIVQEYARPDVIMNGSRRISREYRRSLRARQSDPMAMHLLLETALSDSQHYDIMSTSELEDLRKEELTLTRKIHARKKKLFFESRMHTTSESLRRLDTHTRDGSLPDASPDTNARCKEIAEDVWKMERRLSQLQDQRLKHTAGVLQLNHQLQLQGEDNGQRGLDGAADDGLDFDILNDSFNRFGTSPEITSRLQDVSSTLYSMISSSRVSQNLEFPEPPSESADAEAELEYIVHSLNTVRGLHDGLLTYLQDSRQKASNQEQTAQQTNAVLTGLWDMMAASEEDMRHKNQAGEGAQSSRGTTFETSDDELDPTQPFSIQAFSAKVQRLCNKAVTLSDQQSAMRAQLMDDLQAAHDKHLTSERALGDTKAQLMDARGRFDQAQQEINLIKQQKDFSDNEQFKSRGLELDALRETVASHESTIAGHEATVSSLNADHATTRSKLQDMEAQLAIHSANLEAAQSRATESENAVSEKSRAIEASEAERQQLETELVRVQTELTFSRAELDGAYGTRAQRAAEGAMSSGVKKELETMAEKNMELTQSNAALSGRVGTLERELGELIGAHEGMVRQLLEAEKDRDSSEDLVDQLKEKVEVLERGITDEKVRVMGRGASVGLDGGSSPMSMRSMDVPRAAGTDSTSIAVMRNEFKGMMRELRANHFRSLKAEQDERRRLEGLVRSLRKDQGTAQSPTSAAALSPQQSGQSRAATNSAIAA